MSDTKENLFYNWIQGNIYDHKKHDGGLYIVFYVIIPVIVTAWSLYEFPSSVTAGVYCYLSILISALNCLYDAINRWRDEKSVVNVKLVIIIISVSVVCVYCLFIIIGMLVTKDTISRGDTFLYSYFAVIIVALFDFVCCFISDLTMREYTKI